MKNQTLETHIAELDGRIAKMTGAANTLRETAAGAKAIVAEFTANPQPGNIRDAIASATQATHAESLLTAIGNIEARAKSIRDAYVVENAESIGALLRGELAQRTKNRDGYRTAAAARVGELSAKIALTPDPDANPLFLERDRIEAEMGTREQTLLAAQRSIGHLNNFQAFESAKQHIANVNFEP